MVCICVLASACAPKIRTAPVVTPPRFPEFVYPAPPPALASRPAAAIHRRGWTFLQSGDLQQADRDFADALKVAPDFFPAETGGAYVRLAAKDPDAAVERFARALAHAPAYTPALVGKGQALLALRRDREALEAFEAALAADPALADVRARVDVLRVRGAQDTIAAARRAAEDGRFDEAREAYGRAMTISPDSPFLYRELAIVERRQGRDARALELFRKVVELDASDARSRLQIGELLESRGDLEGALEAFVAVDALEPSPDVTRRIAALRERLAVARLPAEYRAIPDAEQITRGELAALVGIRLDGLLQQARPRSAVVITDTRGHWAAAWVMAVARAGVIEAFPNHTFLPRAGVRRADLAQTVSRLLSLVAARRPALAKQWQAERRKIADVPPGHLSYPAVSLAVASGVLPLADAESFQLSRPVSGREAVAAIDRIERLSAGDGRTNPPLDAAH